MMVGEMEVTRGQTKYTFTSQHDDADVVLESLSHAERWIWASAERLSRLDEQSSLEAAAPGDTVRIRTR